MPGFIMDCRGKVVRFLARGGWEISELMTLTEMSRSRLDGICDLVSEGRACQVSRGRSRARLTEGGYGE
jgi:hypothetical protein